MAATSKSGIAVDRQDAIAFVTLSNPGKLNAINVSMWNELRASFIRLANDATLRCIVVRGEDGNFAAGADIEEFPVVRNTPESGMRYHTHTIGRTLEAIGDCPHPTVAAIEGVCVGGGLEIACACDIRIASPTARFGIPVNRLGFPLAPGELTHLLRLAGKAATLEILLEGRVFGAAEAKDKGLLHRIVDDALADALATAKRIAAGAPLAARINKKLVKRLAASAMPLSAHELEEAFSFFSSNDYQEGIDAFLNKRPPEFSGK